MTPAEWQTVDVAAGSSLWRHHNSNYAADTLRPAHPNPTGRFDCPDPDGWASSYYAFTTRVAVGEALLRDVAVSANAVNPRRLAGSSVSRVVVTNELRLVDLRGAAAWGPLNNDLSLLGFPSDNDAGLYARARDAAADIRAKAPQTNGLCWYSARDSSQESLLLWGDDENASLTVAEIVPITEAEFGAIASLLAAWAVPLMAGDDIVDPDDVQAGILGWTS